MKISEIAKNLGVAMAAMDDGRGNVRAPDEAARRAMKIAERWLPLGGCGTMSTTDLGEWRKALVEELAIVDDEILRRASDGTHEIWYAFAEDAEGRAYAVPESRVPEVRPGRRLYRGIFEAEARDAVRAYERAGA